MNVVSSLWESYPVQDKYHRNELASDVKTDIILFPVHYFCSKNQLVALSDNFSLSYDSLKIAISFEVAARPTPLTDCAATETAGVFACGYIRLCSIRLFSATTLATIVYFILYGAFRFAKNNETSVAFLACMKNYLTGDL